jgi:hypothetical protein
LAFARKISEIEAERMNHGIIEIEILLKNIGNLVGLFKLCRDFTGRRVKRGASHAN